MSICLFVCLFIRHTFTYRLIDIFAPTSWSQMSKLFRFFESLRRSNGKNLSQIWKLLLIKGVKLPHRKKVFFFGKFCFTSRIFLVSVLLSASVEKFFVSRLQDFHRIGPLGRFGLVVSMSMCLFVFLSPSHIDLKGS